MSSTLSTLFSKKFIARSRLRIQLGMGVAGIVLTGVNMLTFAKVWENVFIGFGIPMIILYVTMPVGFATGCWAIGFYYDTKGFWKEETSHSNANLNPEFVSLCQLVDRMDNKLDELNKKLEEINKKNMGNDKN